MEAYLCNGAILSDPKVTFSLIRRAKHFIMVDDVLFKKSFGRPILCCLGPKEAERALREIHEGCYRNHLEGQALAKKVILASYSKLRFCSDGKGVSELPNAQ